MRITDRSVWTAPPPNPISTCTVQVAGGPGGLATYYYRLVTHYPIGDVISEPFEVSNAPKPMSATHYVIISWQGIPGVTSYDLLRTDTFQLPPDGTNCALAIGLAPTTTIFNDQGQTLLPYSISGLKAGSPVDGWAMMNNRDFHEPVLELWPTIRLTKILFGDGSEQQSAGGGVIAGVSSVFGRTGVVIAQSGDYNAGQITIVPPIGTWTTVQNALQAIANGATQTPWKSDIDGGGFDLTNVGNIEAGNIDVTGQITINGQPVTGESLWEKGTGGAIYYDGGDVGINEPDPQFTLDINGDLNVNGGGYYINGILFAGSGGGGGPSPGGYAHVGTAPPASPQEGQFWFSTNTLRLNIWALGTWIQI